MYQFFWTAPFEPTVAPRSAAMVMMAQPTTDSTTPKIIFAPVERPEWKGERIVIRCPTWLLGCVRTSLQASEERIGGIIEDVIAASVSIGAL